MRFLLILITLLLVPSYGCAIHGHASLSIEKKAKSFMFVSGSRKHLLCAPGEYPGQATCAELESRLTASGFVIAKRSKKTYVMTAGHVCDGKIGEENISYLISVDLFVTARDGTEYKAKVVAVDLPKDICVLSVPGLDAPALKIARSETRLGAESFNIAAPLSMFYPGNPGMSPVFTGRFSGRVGHRAFFTIPAMGGSSGSPVLNTRGQVIGMIVARHYQFNHISVSPTREDLINFLADALD